MDKTPVNHKKMAQKGLVAQILINEERLKASGRECVDCKGGPSRQYTMAVIFR